MGNSNRRATSEIEQQKKYLGTLAQVEDPRLLILLAFNGFEEVMRTFLAWRLTCSVDQLPKSTSGGPLVGLVMAGVDQELVDAASAFVKLRNDVAHNFHSGTWGIQLRAFFKLALVDESEFDFDSQRNTDILYAVAVLSSDIALALGHLSDRPVLDDYSMLQDLYIDNLDRE